MSASGSRSAPDWSSGVMWPFPKRSFHDSWKPSGSGASFLGWNYRNKRDFCSSHHLQRNPGLAWATRGVPQGKDRFKVFDLFMLKEASGHRRAYGGDGFFSTVSLPPSLSLSRSHTQTPRVCACLCARASVKTSSPITVSDHSALAGDFLNPVGLPRCVLPIALLDTRWTHSSSLLSSHLSTFQ